ncbi:MAG: hypothetical protein FWG40_04630 [Peptococcaceae bacterium]|nr:hypothetical protein [Peptococcaceae bacterium]
MDEDVFDEDGFDDDGFDEDGFDDDGFDEDGFDDDGFDDVLEGLLELPAACPRITEIAVLMRSEESFLPTALEINSPTRFLSPDFVSLPLSKESAKLPSIPPPLSDPLNKILKMLPVSLAESPLTPDIFSIDSCGWLLKRSNRLGLLIKALETLPATSFALTISFLQSTYFGLFRGLRANYIKTGKDMSIEIYVTKWTRSHYVKK